MRKILTFLASFLVSFVISSNIIQAQTVTPTVSETNEALLEDESEVATGEAEVVVTIEPIPSPRPNLTRETEETTDSLQELLATQELGPVFLNPLKYAIRASVDVGVPPNTIVLLLLLPAIAAIIASARHLVGIRGFGIFLPAALSVVFMAIGPVAGIGLFLVIVASSTITRMGLRAAKVKLQYLPRMALLLLFVVLGVLSVLFAAPVIRHPDIINLSIFPVLILVLLAEEFSKVQLGKSARTAINLTTETLILSLISFIFLTLEGVQHFALLNPEWLLIIVGVSDYLIGKYVGLRFVEFWRFRKLITG